MAERRPEAPTLRALLDRADLGLRAIEVEALEDGELDRSVRWVHSSDLSDPTPFLSEGLVLLTTGTQFGTDDVDCEAYVRRLSLRGVAGLGFGTEVVRDGIPSDLIEACRTQGMPLFEVPYRTPFIAVARANAEAIAAEAYARRSWALAAQRAISLAALRPDGLGAGLAELARQLGSWVGFYDTAGTLARSYPAGALDDQTHSELAREAVTVLRGGARAASSIRVGGHPFSLQTLGRGGHLRGVLAIAADSLDQAARGVVTSVIAMVGLALEQNNDLARARGVLRAGVLLSLLDDDPALPRRIAREVWGGLPPAPIVVGLAAPVGRSADAVAAYLELRADERRGRLFFGRGDDGLVVCVCAEDRGMLDDLAEAFDLQIGVSTPTAYTEFSRAHHEARVARGSGANLVTTFDEVAGRGLLALLDSGDAQVAARAMLAPIVTIDRATGSALLETVRTWLEHDANADATARALGIHRHTVRARVRQAERLIERDLSSFAARAELWAALQLIELSS